MASLWESVSNSLGTAFGFSINREEEKAAEVFRPTFAPKQEDDGAVQIAASGGFYGTFVDLEGTVRSEAELINKYRDIAQHPEVDSAIEDIICEAIVSEEGEPTVQVILDDIPDLSPELKMLIENEFDYLLGLLEFNTKSYEVFKRWYIDGRLYYHVMIDITAPQEGIKELRFLDPRRIRKIREVAKVKDKALPSITVEKTVNEYYMYSDKDLVGGNKNLVSDAATVGLKIAKDSIIQCSTGIMDRDNKMILGFLHKAIKPLNQLRAIEDAVVIYRISRAPERRVFYIDVGNLPKIKADQYIADMMTKHRNKLVYDSSTGEIKDDRKFMTMLEDYWLPRREGGRSTEIQTLPPGQNLGELADVQYFQNKLYKSLNVPLDRLDDNAVFDIGRATQITRSEIKFAKFIDRMRLKFSSLFLRCLEKQLILKGIMSPEEWDALSPKIKFRFLRDNDFAELKDQEILMNRVNTLNAIQPFIGMYYSHSWVRKHILKQDEIDIAELNQEISEESMMPQYQQLPPGTVMGPDGTPVDPNTGLPVDPATGMPIMGGPNDGNPTDEPPKDKKKKDSSKNGPPRTRSKFPEKLHEINKT